MSKTVSSHWWVYIIEADDGSLYTGITTDMKRRWRQHCCVKSGSGNSGARFFRGRSPQRLRWLEEAENRSLASRREAEIKRLSRAAKLQMLSDDAALPAQTADRYALVTQKPDG